MKTSAKLLGTIGEQKSCDYLTEDGYEILEKNYRCKFGEIDIIAKKGGLIIFIEVKTRSKNNFCEPEESVNDFKIRHIRNCANYYIQQKELGDYEFNFDVISIIVKDRTMSLKHFRNCNI